MRWSWFTCLWIGLSCSVYSQDIRKIVDLQPEVDYANVHVVRLFGDSLSTSFAIWIKDTVATHRHEYHTETIYVLEGEGKFYFNDEIRLLKPNDALLIPKMNWHAVKVTSEQPMKVLSIQSPGFDGTDRVFESDYLRMKEE
jgi:mannose-6-phosphate isomerase-like protein (cupin superfamily)